MAVRLKKGRQDRVHSDHIASDRFGIAVTPEQKPITGLGNGRDGSGILSVPHILRGNTADASVSGVVGNILHMIPL